MEDILIEEPFIDEEVIEEEPYIEPIIPIKVYAKLDDDKNIIEVNSEIFLQDTKGYVQIDEGVGDKYAHAQGHYLENGLTNEQGEYNYYFELGKVLSKQ